MATDLLSADPPVTASTACDVAPAAVGQTLGEGLVGHPSRSLVGDEAKSVDRGNASLLIADLVQLTKPRIVVMILVTTIATAMIGAGGLVSSVQLVWLLLATAAVAGSAGAANQIWERVIDQRMSRTANRPLAAGRMHLAVASLFTFVLLAAGTIALQLKFGPAPAIVGVVTWLLYVVVYTPMKTRTAWNTTVGAVAGALPVLIGFTALGGELSGPAGWLLVGVLAAWQYPHFMAIAWMYRRQYAEAGFCMTTTVEPTGKSAGWQSVVGSLFLIGCAIALCFLPGGWLPGTIAAILATASAVPMLMASVAFLAEPNDQRARKLLRSSLLVLPAVLAICTIRLFW
ncbi:MAG: protoheme IX farnesyltransferase [Planctomycetota bacterium]